MGEEEGEVKGEGEGEREADVKLLFFVLLHQAIYLSTTINFPPSPLKQKAMGLLKTLTEIWKIKTGN